MTDPAGSPGGQGPQGPPGPEGPHGELQCEVFHSVNITLGDGRRLASIPCFCVTVAAGIARTHTLAKLLSDANADWLSAGVDAVCRQAWTSRCVWYQLGLMTPAVLLLGLQHMFRHAGVLRVIISSTAGTAAERLTELGKDMQQLQHWGSAACASAAARLRA
jgi:hypothetical protein